MKAMRWLWHELTRPRGPVSHRFYRVGRSSRSGVALLIAIACLLFLTMAGVEISSTSLSRVRYAANARDEAKAEALAYSGLNFYRLILVTAAGMDSKIKSATGGGGPIASMLGPMASMISGDMLWQMVPMINTNLLRMVFVSGDSTPDADDMAELQATELSEEDRERSEAEGTKPGFLSFEGDFLAEVTDESKRINIKNIQGADLAGLQQDPAAVQVHALMTGMNSCQSIRENRAASIDDDSDNTAWLRDRNLEPWELIGNLADWVDVDQNRAYLGGTEDTLYERLDEPYKAKNAPFDTLEEVRLVEGWHRDDVWERFGDNLTVFGDGKVNVNTAECEVLWALVRTASQIPLADTEVDSCLRAVEGARMLVPFNSADQFVQFLQNSGQNQQQSLGAVAQGSNIPQGTCSLTVNPTFKDRVTTKTKVFRVTSVGSVGNAQVTIEAVYDFSKSVEGETLYWRID